MKCNVKIKNHYHIRLLLTIKLICNNNIFMLRVNERIHKLYLIVNQERKISGQTDITKPFPTHLEIYNKTSPLNTKVYM